MAAQLDPNKSPTALFCALETALAQGDFHHAADLRDRLEALGFKVSVHIPPAKKPRKVTPQAPAAPSTGGRQ